MQIRISIYDETNGEYNREKLYTSAYSYPVRDVSFYGKDEDFYNKIIEYVEFLQCKDNEQKKQIAKLPQNNTDGSFFNYNPCFD